MYRTNEYGFENSSSVGVLERPESTALKERAGSRTTKKDIAERILRDHEKTYTNPRTYTVPGRE